MRYTFEPAEGLPFNPMPSRSAGRRKSEMKRGKQKVISLFGWALLMSVAGCKQVESPAERHISRKNSVGAADETALAETLATLLYVAVKRARESGQCEELPRLADPPAQAHRSDKGLLCQQAARQQAKPVSSSEAQSGGARAIHPPKR
jgi:hypothetical protein